MSADEPWLHADAPDDDWEPDDEDLAEMHEDEDPYDVFVKEQQKWEAAGATLRQARVRLGISKREAARRAGLSDGAWRHLESGIKTAYGTLVLPNPRPENLIAAAKAVDLDPVLLFQLTGRHIPEEIRYLNSSRPGAVIGPNDVSFTLDGLTDDDIELVGRLIARLRGVTE